jgi:hypothetical protein
VTVDHLRAGGGGEGGELLQVIVFVVVGST